MAKVMVGMSGGVDSSVAAKLLIDSGYDVTGVTLKLFDGGDISEDFRTCCSLSDVEDARSVCYRLGIDHFVFNFKEAFRKKVINQFTESYLNGKTPNPCIECNRHIKFDKMLRRAEELGFDYIATGHYAERVYDYKTNRYILKRPKDRSKDQTYVLYGLTQYQLSKTLFPLGEYEKSDIRRIAEAAGLINSRKPDSQDICFVPDGDYASFIKKNTGAEIVSYGAPVLPGAMFLLSYYNGNIPIIGLPGCVMYAKRTIFDLALPRIMADDKISAEELAALGEGGLCLNCPVCTFPNCGFGK